jgi:DNA-binding NtrC family response regulator
MDAVITPYVPDRPLAIHCPSVQAPKPMMPSRAESRAESRLQAPGPVFLGHSAAAKRVQSQIHQAVNSSSPVLVVGAHGTGKRLVAEILHHFGGGEIPSLEDVHVEAGVVDRIGDFAYLGPAEQLELHEQARVPGLVGLGRLVVGTRLDPDSIEGRARLNPQLVRWCPIRIDLPSLVDRIEDLAALALAIIQRTPARRPVGGISDNALDCLRGHSWPGNVRELEQVIRQAIDNGSGEQIELADLPSYLRVRDALHRGESAERRLCLEEAEKQAIKRALDYARGNKRKAARLLCIGKTTLYRKIKAYELE